MLSGETSIGKYPVAAVHIMNHVARVTEDYLDATGNHHRLSGRASSVSPPGVERGEASDSSACSLPAAVAAGAWRTVHDLKATLVVVWSPSGNTARTFSQQRFAVPVMALSDNPLVVRQMALYYGLVPRPMLPPKDISQFITQVDQQVRDQHLGQPGDRIVLAAGSFRDMPETLTAVIIHTLGALPGSATITPGSPEVVELEKQ
jgi:pyruvate kinase